MHTLISAIELHNSISCLHLTQSRHALSITTINNACMKQHLSTQPTSQLWGIAMYICTLYYSYPAIVRAWTSVKSGCVPAMVAQRVVAMLKALVFQCNILSYQGPAKNTRPVKVGRHDLHYDNKEVNSIQYVFNLMQLCENHHSVYS